MKSPATLLAMSLLRKTVRTPAEPSRVTGRPLASRMNVALDWRVSSY